MTKRAIWTAEKVRELGLVTSLETAAQILGIGRSKAYEMARTGEFPVRVMRVGRVYRVPVNPILNIWKWSRDDAASVAARESETSVGLLSRRCPGRRQRSAT